MALSEKAQYRLLVVCCILTALGGGFILSTFLLSFPMVSALLLIIFRNKATPPYSDHFIKGANIILVGGILVVLYLALMTLVQSFWPEALGKPDQKEQLTPVMYGFLAGGIAIGVWFITQGWKEWVRLPKPQKMVSG